MTNLPSYADYGTHDESVAPELWDGVVGAWAPCLGPTGSRLHDMSRSVAWGEVQGATLATDWQISEGQYGLNFDGSDNNVRIDRNLLDNPAQTCTLWIRGTAFTDAYSTLLDKGVQTNTRYWSTLVKSNGKMAYYVNTGAPVFVDGTGVFTLTTARWYFIAMSYSAEAGLTGYVNGVVDGTAAANGTPTTGGTFVNIGSSYQSLVGGASGRFFNGLIDDVKIYNRVLSANEIRQVYQLGRGGMLERKPRRRIQSIQPVAFRAHYATQRAQLIGGGLR